MLFGTLKSSKYLTRTLNAPKGDTRVAGANAYATKLAASPIPTENNNKEKFEEDDNTYYN
jgi:hypothetical protein